MWPSYTPGHWVPFLLPLNDSQGYGGDILTRHKVKVKVILRSTISRPVCLDVRHQFGTRDQFFSFFLQLFLDSYRFLDVGSPLWREVVSVVFNFFWSSPAQTFSGLSPTGLMSIFYCLYFWDSSYLEGQVPVFVSPCNKVAQLYFRALG
jgi:hypothetical protein